MPRKPNSTSNTLRKICEKCKKEKILKDNFYNTNSKFSLDGKTNICKSCIKEMIDIDNVETIYEVLQLMNLPFIIDVWEKSKEDGKETFGTYIKNINSLPQYRGYTWTNSIFETSKLEEVCDIENKEEKNNNYNIDYLQNKWGYGYELDELLAFERKYQMLKNNYPEKTAMHTEALLTYIRYRCCEEKATAKKNIKEAKEWGALASKAAQDAKINPSQLSRADLTDGLSTFGELVRAVEQTVDIISILPKFKEKPQDKVDFTIWCYINYIRDLKGLPPCKYDDIYNFYEERKKEYEKHIVKDENIFENTIEEDNSGD